MKTSSERSSTYPHSDQPTLRFPSFCRAMDPTWMEVFWDLCDDCHARFGTIWQRFRRLKVRLMSTCQNYWLQKAITEVVSIVAAEFLHLEPSLLSLCLDDRLSHIWPWILLSIAVGIKSQKILLVALYRYEAHILLRSLWMFLSLGGYGFQRAWIQSWRF